MNDGTPKDAQLLRAARLERGMSVREVARAAKISEDSVRGAERRGVRNVRVSRVARLCETLGVDIDSLAIAVR